MDGEQWYGTGSFAKKDPRRMPGLRSADDFEERSIDLNEQLVRNRTATFFFRMNSDAMVDAGIHSGDILIVDRSIKAVSGKIIVAVVNGELLVRKLQTHIKGVTLLAENKKYGNIQIDEFSSYAAWGVVVYAIHAV